MTPQQSFEDSLNIKTAWLNRKKELADAEREFCELTATGDERHTRSLQTLRDIIDVKQWKINPVAGCYIRAHQKVQRISIRNRLNDFMQAHRAELAAALAPEWLITARIPLPHAA